VKIIIPTKILENQHRYSRTYSNTQITCGTQMKETKSISLPRILGMYHLPPKVFKLPNHLQRNCITLRIDTTDMHYITRMEKCSQSAVSSSSQDRLYAWGSFLVNLKHSFVHILCQHKLKQHVICSICHYRFNCQCNVNINTETACFNKTQW
jgi:hypothetical protein